MEIPKFAQGGFVNSGELFISRCNYDLEAEMFKNLKPRINGEKIKQHLADFDEINCRVEVCFDGTSLAL